MFVPRHQPFHALAVRYRERGLSREEFQGQLDWLLTRFRVVDPPEFAAEVCAGWGELAPPTLLSFDGTTGDRRTMLRTILDHRGLSGVFFVAADDVDAASLRQDGHQVGLLTSPSPDRDVNMLVQTLRADLDRLAQHLGERPTWLTCPLSVDEVDGSARQRLNEAIREMGIRVSVTTAGRPVRPAATPSRLFGLPRINATDLPPVREAVFAA